MRRLLAVFVVVLAFWAGAAGHARAQSNAAGPARVQVSLVSNRTSVVPGEQFALALRQVIAPGWHTYWRNPGDAGEPPEMTWQLPDGMTVGAFEWPTPKTFTTTAADLTLVNYVYEGEVLLPMTATAPAAARPGDRLALSASVTWLVCDESTCVPEEAEVSLSLLVAAASVPDAGGRRVSCPRRRSSAASSSARRRQ
jgi:thiol:disulfide interchange protein DsbD